MKLMVLDKSGVVVEGALTRVEMLSRLQNSIPIHRVEVTSR